MCNLYSIGENRVEIAFRAKAESDFNNNQPPMAGVYPDYAAPVVFRDASGQRVMKDMRWGMPTPRQYLDEAAQNRADKLIAKGKPVDLAELFRMEPDKGVTNVRHAEIAHWQQWLAPSNRCLVPMTSFSEPDQVGGSLKPIWFALEEDRPLAFFAGVWTPWACVRRIKTGWEECDVFGFLTTYATEPVKTYHNKAQPVILTEEAQWDLWLSDAPWGEVKQLQRPLPDAALKVVARDLREDLAAVRQPSL